jgi:hypothetical protein
MKIDYITTDLEFDSPMSLDRIVAELAPSISINRHDHADDLHRVALGVGVQGSPEQTVAHICELLEGLSPLARRDWDQCTRRVVDIAFESGTTPQGITYTLSAELVRRVADLGLAIAVTIYRVGAYSSD